MKKVPLTDVINSWLNADKMLAEKCEDESCDYDSSSAYKGFMVGFDEGVNSQMISEDEAKRMLIITKCEIANGFAGVDMAKCSRLVTEDDCLNLISSSQQYWFLVGAMWLMEQVRVSETK